MRERERAREGDKHTYRQTERQRGRDRHRQVVMEKNGVRKRGWEVNVMPSKLTGYKNHIFTQLVLSDENGFYNDKIISDLYPPLSLYN